ncbi:MAG: Dabb family protein [Opitutales bacterium]|jgi:hypothetical protein
MITHVAIFWVDKPVDKKTADLLAGAKKLADIPGVKHFRFGPAVPSDRGVVDDSFAVAISMDFKSRKALKKYTKHVDHVKFVQGPVKDAVRRMVAYDFGDDE